MRSEKQSDGNWWLVDVPDPQCVKIGPYTSEKEAAISRVRIQKFYDATGGDEKKGEKFING
jgi:hypothetical protein